MKILKIPDGPSAYDIPPVGCQDAHDRREAGERSRRVHEIARRRWNSTKGWLTKPGAKAAGLASCNLLRIKVQSYDVWRIVSRQMAFLERRSVKPD